MNSTPSSEIAHATVHSFAEAAPVGHSEVCGLVGSASAYLISRRLASRPEPLFIIVPDQQQAERFAADLAFYHPHSDQIGLFPHWEVGPYEALTPIPISKRPALQPWRLCTPDG